MKRPIWRPTFGIRQQVNAREENVPIWLDAPFNIDDEDFIGNCMRDATNASTFSPQSELLKETYGPTQYSDVNLDGMKQKKVALLKDCAFIGGKQLPRSNPGPLTAYELYELLRRPRFHVEDAKKLTTIGDSTEVAPHTNCTTNLDLTEHDHTVPDADRRLIYLVDLDKWSVLALLATVSRFQIGPLRHALYQHVAAEAYIGLASCADEIFELAFHLPFRAWRPREGGESGSGVTDVSFLNWDDEWHWVAYCFIDTQFQGSSEDRESPEEHYNNMQNSGTLSMDPCGNMSFATDGIGPDPRYWFLLVLKARLASAIDELLNIAHRVDQSIEGYRQKHASESQSTEHAFPKDVAWMSGIQILTPELSRDTDKLLDACREFLSGHANELDDGPSRQRNAAIIEIDQHAKRLRRLKKRFDAMTNICNAYTRNLSLLMDVRQKTRARDNQAISTIILLVCTPVLLASGILSMDDNVLRQTIPNFSSSPRMFLKVLAITTVAIFGVALQQRLIFFPRQPILDMLRVALRALPCDLRWLRNIKAAVAASLGQYVWTSAPGGAETHTMSRPRRFRLRRRTTTTSGTLGDAESLTQPDRVLLPGRHLRSNTN